MYKRQAQNQTLRHTVKKGETVYSISRQYNVNPKDVLDLNPKAGNLIYVNDVLLIPNTSPSTSVKPISNYKVKRGETKYGLAKQFGITISELENNNPHIRNGLQAGHILNISGVNENTQSVVVDDSSNDRQKPLNFSDTYLVQKGDTKYSLSKRFNVSIPELENQNPEIVDMLKYGTVIQVPGDEIVSDNTQNIASEKTEIPIEEHLSIQTDTITVSYTHLTLPTTSRV